MFVRVPHTGVQVSVNGVPKVRSRRHFSRAFNVDLVGCSATEPGTEEWVTGASAGELVCCCSGWQRTSHLVDHHPRQALMR